MAKAGNRPIAAIRESGTTARSNILRKLGLQEGKFEAGKPRMLTDAQRAKLLRVPIDLLNTPIVLSPVAPLKGKSALSATSVMAVFPEWPKGSGRFIFNSNFNCWNVGVDVVFPRVKKGTNHLVEFHVELHASMSYSFRVGRSPGDSEDVTVQGAKTHILTALFPPMDQFDGSIEFGAWAYQLNPSTDDAPWSLYSIRVTTTQ